MATEIRSVFHPDVAEYEQVNRDALRLLSPPGPGYLALLGLSVSLVGIAAIGFAYQIIFGLGYSGLTNPVGWGTFITTFVFWVGIGHAGTLVSAILFLFRAPWRQSIYRLAEAMTVFAVLTAALFLRAYQRLFLGPSSSGVGGNSTQRAKWVVLERDSAR